MRFTQTTISLFLLFLCATLHAQLGFCPGSKGEPIFTENFGNGTTYGPALPAGVTTYPFVTGAPNDGQYTLYYNSYQYTTWHNSPDHTPDATNGPNGKMLLMNANAVTSGDFYKKTVSGLCVNTTFEFSAWLMNVYNPTTNYCGAGQIPINVRFEIWNSDETVLLGSGNTGNILGSPSPLWQQFALVFTTTNETSVVLKMKNNGLGGCGNDLAIDDISFSACADLTTISSPSVAGTTYATCNNPASIQLNAATAGGVSYFYQWQSSPDGTTWTDIAGETNPTYTASNITSLAYYRARAAQDAANLSNVFCSTLSNVFTVSLLAMPNAATSNGNVVICSDEAIPALSVTAEAGASVNWYSAPSAGTLLQANSTTFSPTASGTYYAETYNATTGCIASPRTPVSLSIVPLPNAAISATPSVCSGNTATVNFSGTPNAILTYTVNSGANQTIALNASGTASITTSALTSGTTYTLVSAVSPSLSSCIKTINQSAAINVNSTLTASLSGVALVCSGSSATVNFSGTPNAVITYTVDSGVAQTITLNASGQASATTAPITSSTVFALTGVVLGTCSQAVSQSVSISATAVPAAAVSVNPASICANQTSTVTFTGTPNAIVVYKVDGGANQTISLNASGTASLVTPTLTSNSSYVLVSATSSSLSSCSSTLSGSATIFVNPSPTAAIASNAPVCNGNTATVTFSGTPNAVVSYSINSGANQTVTLNGSGIASVTTAPVTSPLVYTLVNVASSGPNGCTQALSQSVTVSAIAALSASVSANSATVCNGQSSTFTFTGTPNAVVTYTINGGTSQTVTLNAAGTAVQTTVLSGNTTYQLTSVTLPGTGCSNALSGSASVSVNPRPVASYSGDLEYCEGETVTIALASNLGATTFDWTVSQNGVSGATAGSGNQISQLPVLTGATPGTITYTVTPWHNGCAGNPTAITVDVYPLPVPAIADGVICTTSSAPASTQFYTLDTHLSPADYTFQWFFGGNVIAGASGSTYDATQVGQYSVVATNSAGCASVPVFASVTQMPMGESLVVDQSQAFSEHPRIVVTVIGGGGPFLYQLDDLGFQPSNVFEPVSAGTHTITVIDANCTNLAQSVTIIDYPKYFTPNADGFHDTWNITGVGDAAIYIFDRYGKLIKQISSQGNGWDGTYNGRALPSTDYWFSIDYSEGGKAKTFRSHFALKR